MIYNLHTYQNESIQVIKLYCNPPRQSWNVKYAMQLTLKGHYQNTFSSLQFAVLSKLLMVFTKNHEQMLKNVTARLRTRRKSVQHDFQKWNKERTKLMQAEER